MVLTLSKAGLNLTEVSSELVKLTNETGLPKPIFFYIAPRDFSLGGVAQTIKALLGGP